MNSHKSKAFTLMELLVVIAIIALLLSILMPSLRKAKELARNVICMSNFHQYGLAGFMYLNDNEDRFPDSYYWLYSPSSYTSDTSDVRNGLHRWHYAAIPPDGSLWPYLSDKGINLCPTFYLHAKRQSCVYCGRRLGDPDFDIEYSYSMNYWLGPNYYLDEVALKRSDVKSPSTVFWFSEENPFITLLSPHTLNDNNLNIAGPSTAVDTFGTYHRTKAGDLTSGKANLVFVNGHVGSFHMDRYNLLEAWKLAWPR